MFMTLLKHEWRATKGILGLLCLIILGGGAAMGGSGLYLTLKFQSEMGNICSVIFFTLGFVIIPVCCAGGLFYLIWRFYSSRFTDEGYLTFTLPVTTHQNLLSGITNILWGCVLVLLAAAGAMVIALGLLLLGYHQYIAWADVWMALQDVLPELWESFVSMWCNSWQNILWFLAAVVFAAVSNVILMMLAVTIGSIVAKKHKILAALGAYWAVGLVKNTIFTIGLIRTSSAAWFLQFHFYAGLVILFAGYFLMHFLMDRKLNLN